ncbi:hypothetical protein EDD11_006249 [Mortierella claussenii]|nr:hypothetical protein EDD11_006249 [Mortierella claussenii]
MALREKMDSQSVSSASEALAIMEIERILRIDDWQNIETPLSSEPGLELLVLDNASYPRITEEIGQEIATDVATRQQVEAARGEETQIDSNSMMCSLPELLPQRQADMTMQVQIPAMPLYSAQDVHPAPALAADLSLWLPSVELTPVQSSGFLPVSSLQFPLDSTTTAVTFDHLSSPDDLALGHLSLRSPPAPVASVASSVLLTPAFDSAFDATFLMTAQDFTAMQDMTSWQDSLSFLTPTVSNSWEGCVSEGDDAETFMQTQSPPDVPHILMHKAEIWPNYSSSNYIAGDKEHGEASDTIPTLITATSIATATNSTTIRPISTDCLMREQGLLSASPSFLPRNESHELLTSQPDRGMSTTPSASTSSSSASTSLLWPPRDYTHQLLPASVSTTASHYLPAVPPCASPVASAPSSPMPSRPSSPLPPSCSEALPATPSTLQKSTSYSDLMIYPKSTSCSHLSCPRTSRPSRSYSLSCSLPLSMNLTPAAPAPAALTKAAAPTTLPSPSSLTTPSSPLSSSTPGTSIPTKTITPQKFYIMEPYRHSNKKIDRRSFNSRKELKHARAREYSLRSVSTPSRQNTM